MKPAARAEPAPAAVDPVRRRVAAAVAAAPLVLAGCTGLPWDRRPPAAAGPVAPPPTVRIGDRWVYQTINRYNGSVIDEITATVIATTPQIVVRLAARDAGTVVEERYADAWSVISEATFDRPITFESPMPLVPNPPSLGAWRSRGRYRAAGYGDLLHWEQRLHAVRWERLQVPAGSYDCLRIVRMIDYQHPDVFRYHPERVDTLWYAPAVHRWVQREWSGSHMPGAPTRRFGRAEEDRVGWELMSYAPAPG
jgi:hypothetical protein